MPAVCEIDAEVLFYGERTCAAGQFEGAHGTLPACAIGGTGTHTEKWQAAPTREGLEVTAGVGYSVDLMKGIWKVGDSGRMR
jgi:hypothetical protein